MRYFILTIFVASFMLLPVFMLNTLVMPQLTQMKQTYSNLDVMAARAASVDNL